MNFKLVLWTLFIHSQWWSSLNGFLTPMSPLVISSECETLKKRIATEPLLMVNYKIDCFTMENLKHFYHHIDEFGTLMELIQDRKVCRVINFEFSEKYSNLEKYHKESQMFNIIRAFINGVYQTKEPKYFPNTWKDQLPMKKVMKHRTMDELYFHSNKKMYMGNLTRFDSRYERDYETARHLVTFPDFDIQKNLHYLQKIENPIGIKITGRISLKKIHYFIEKINPVNESGKLVFIFSLNRFQSNQRYLDRFFHSLRLDKKWSSSFIFHLDRRKNMEKQVDHVYNMTDKYHLLNKGFYLEFHLQNETIC